MWHRLSPARAPDSREARAFHDEPPKNPTHAPKVTFLLPAGNDPALLTDCLDSVSRQTVGDFDLLVAHDGTNPAMTELISRWIPGRIPGRVLILLAAAAGALLRELVAQATGEWIAPLSPEVRCHPDRLRRQMAILEQRPRLIALGSHAAVLESTGRRIAGIRMPLSEPAELRFQLLHTNPFLHESMLLRRSALLAARSYPELDDDADLDLWFRLSGRGPMANVPQELIAYAPGGVTPGKGRHRELLAEYQQQLFPGAAASDVEVVHRVLSSFLERRHRSPAVGEAVIRLAQAAGRAEAWQGTDFLATRAVAVAYQRCVPRRLRSRRIRLRLTWHRLAWLAARPLRDDP